MSRGYIARSKRNDWRTPRNVLDVVEEALGTIDLDPCGNKRSLVGAREQYLLSRGEDGLRFPWKGRVFVNPPFDNVSGWMEKAALEGTNVKTEIVFLMPARTDTKAWHRWATAADAICFWKGRIRFVGAKASAPFPTAFLYWGSRLNRFRDAFSKFGHVVRP